MKLREFFQIVVGCLVSRQVRLGVWLHFVRKPPSLFYPAVTRLSLHEISLVDRPANPQAIIDLWKSGVVWMVASIAIISLWPQEMRTTIFQPMSFAELPAPLSTIWSSNAWQLAGAQEVDFIENFSTPKL